MTLPHSFVSLGELSITSLQMDVMLCVIVHAYFYRASGFLRAQWVSKIRASMTKSPPMLSKIP